MKCSMHRRRTGELFDTWIETRESEILCCQIMIFQVGSELCVHFILQATNLRSFQLLQEYLNAAKGGITPSRFSYHFELFIKDPSDDEAKDDKALQRVEVSLPPPQVKFHPQRGAEMLPGTKVAIGKLFAACGLSSEVSQGWVGDERVSLSDFFQQASELQRKDASVLSREQQVIACFRPQEHVGEIFTACGVAFFI
jgi:hypothetical protein